MMMMSLQPNPNYSTNHPNVMPLRAMARKASVEEADPDTIVEEGGLNDELAELEKEDKLQEAIKTKRDAKKKAENAKKEAEAKKSRQALFKKIGIGVGAVAGIAVTAGAGLAGYWYFHTPKAAISAEELIKYAGEVANYDTDGKNRLAERFKHLNLHLDKDTKQNGFQKWWTGVTKATLMPKAQKDRVLEYLFKEGGAWQWLTKDPKFKDSMVNITGEIFTKKSEQQDVSLLGSLASSLEIAITKAEQNKGSVGDKGPLLEFEMPIPTHDDNGHLAIETKQCKISNSEFKALGEIADEVVAENKAVLDNNKEGLKEEWYLPSLKESIEKTFNPYLKANGLGEIKLDGLFYDEKATKTGSVAKIFKVTTTEGKSYAIKVIHPSIQTEYFPNILERYILDLQQENPTMSYSTVVAEACKKIGNLAKETTVSNEMNAQKGFCTNVELKHAIFRIHDALASHSTDKSSALLQEWVSDFRSLADISNPEEKAKAKILLMFETFCQLANGLIHGDLHPGNAGIDGNGDLRMIDFGKFIQLKDETTKKVRTLMISLLKQDNDDAISKAIEAVDPAIYAKLKPNQRTAVLKQLKESPFEIIVTLFKYHLLDDPANEINTASMADSGKIEVSIRANAGLEPHTDYQRGGLSEGKKNRKLITRQPNDYNENTNVYYRNDGIYDYANTDHYIDACTDYMNTYKQGAEVFLQALFKGDPTALNNNPVLKKEMMRRVLDEVAICSPGQEMALSIVKTVQEGGLFANQDLTERVANKMLKRIGGGLSNTPLLGDLMKMGAHAAATDTLDDLPTLEKLKLSYYQKEPLNQETLNIKS